MEVAAMEPKLRHGRRLPEIADLALPGTGIARCCRAIAPATADPLRNVFRDDLCDLSIHGLIAGRINDELGGQLAAVCQDDGSLLDLADLDAALHLDLAADDKVRCADVDVIAGGGAPGLHRQAGAVDAEVV